MTDLLSLAEMESDDTELVPEIFPVDARLSISARANVLQALFASANDVTPAKEVIPNTSYVRLAADYQRKNIEVSATDGERAITVNGPAIVRLEGAPLLPGKRMLEILKLAPEDTVRIDVLGQTATIRSGRAVWTVQTPTTESRLPVFEEDLSAEWHSLPKAELLRAFEAVLPAVSHSTARQSLMQAELALNYLTACDGVRAHKIHVPSIHELFTATFPLKFIESAIKELRSTSYAEVAVFSNHNTVGLRLGQDKLLAQRLNFAFPAVNHLVLGPAILNEERLTVNLSDLIGTIKRVRVNADPEYAALSLSIKKNQGEWELVVRSRDKAGNASQESIPADYAGPVATKDLTVNHRYFLEFLNCLTGPEIELRLGESTKTKQAPIYYQSDAFIGSLMQMAPNFIR